MTIPDNRPNFNLTDVFTSTLTKRSADFYPNELIAILEEHKDQTEEHIEWLDTPDGLREDNRELQLTESKERLDHINVMLEGLNWMIQPAAETA
jgi:hypothetical protein